LLTAEDRSGVLAATGSVQGVPMVAFGSDPGVQGGALGVAGCAAIVRAYDVALSAGVPVVGIWHSGGGRLREGADGIHAVGRALAAMTHASGVVLQVSVVLGPAVGGAAYGAALTDIVVLAADGRVSVTGPEVIRGVVGAGVDTATLGRPRPHGERTSPMHVVATTAADAIDRARRLVVLLADAGTATTDAGAVDLGDLLPATARQAYDMRAVVRRLLDDPGIEVHPRWAPNIVTTLGRLCGRTVGVVANNPLRLGGCLDARSADKAARFVRMCDAFGVPLVVLVDTPGYLPGVGQEWGGIVRRGAKLVHAFAEATVPRVTVILRKAYGGAYIAMNSRALGATRVYAWPGAELAVMGPVAAVRILHRRHLAGVPEDRRTEVEAQLAADHAAQTGGLERALEVGVVDEVISPAMTRAAVIGALVDAVPARGRHANIPL
jgi:acetyl-CoA/propionyl-CoA carboxylase carboxyl transferase subunit